MISIRAVGAGNISYYTNSETPGRWMGPGAERLHLPEFVKPSEFANLMRGFSADGVARLTQNSGRPNRVAGVDVTFSVPKTLTIVWLLAPPALKDAIKKVIDAAVAETIRYLQEKATISRRGHGGAIKEKADIVVAVFEHYTNRNGEPQLHYHAVIPNVCVRKDGSTSSLETRPLFLERMVAGTLFQVALAHGIGALGFGLERTREPRHNTVEAVGVPPSLVKEWSSRRYEIVLDMDNRKTSGMEEAAKSALRTRTAKKEMTLEELLPEWQRVAREHGLTPEDIEKLSTARPAHTAHPDRAYDEELNAVVTIALESLSRRTSHFSERDFLRACAEEAIGRGLPVSAVRTAVENELRQGRTLVFVGEQHHERRYTTHETLALEKTALTTAFSLQHSSRHTVSPETLNRAILTFERPVTELPQTLEQAHAAGAPHLQTPPFALSNEQREALAQITVSETDIAVLSGLAGTAKTSILQAAKFAWEATGYVVRGIAVAGKTARGLEETAGVPSTTLASFLTRLERGEKLLNAKTVLVIDEASMVGTADLSRVLSAISSFGSKLVLSGDSRQLPAIEAGGLFKAIEERIGGTNLRTILRQELDVTDPDPFWRRTMVSDFADEGEGRTATGLRALDIRGFLHIADGGRAGAMKSLIDAWKEVGMKEPDQNLIFAGTSTEVRDLNQLAQSARRSAHQLGIRSARINGQTLYEKDRIIFTAASKRYAVENGDLGKVSAIDLTRKTIDVTLDGGRHITIAYSEFDKLALGYAVTCHKAQGVTTRNTFALVGGDMTDREMTYVVVSRARRDTHLFVERAIRYDLDSNQKIDRTFDELVRRMSYSRQKQLAHDVQRENVLREQNSQVIVQPTQTTQPAQEPQRLRQEIKMTR